MEANNSKLFCFCELPPSQKNERLIIITIIILFHSRPSFFSFAFWELIQEVVVVVAAATAMAQGMASNRNRNPCAQEARKVMVVADPSRESAGALQYTLAHAVIEQDELILLHVENPSSWRNTISTFLKMPSLGSSITASLDRGGGGGGGVAAAAPDGEGLDFLEEMKHACSVSQPKMKVRVVKVEMDGRDKASIVLSQSKTHGVDVVVIGQKRNISSALLGYKRPAGGSMKGVKAIDTAEYLIRNSSCTCVSVQRKGQNGGFVLNSKTHRNFWLLA